jgi:hypothetical protein
MNFRFFRVFKTLKETASDHFDDKSLKDQIMKLIYSDKQTASLFTIRGLFRKTALTRDSSDRPYTIVFNEAALRGIMASRRSGTLTPSLGSSQNGDRPANPG